MKKLFVVIGILGILGWMNLGVCDESITICYPGGTIIWESSDGTETYPPPTNACPKGGTVTVYSFDGTITGTYSTIQKGVNACAEGGTVSASAGTFKEVVYVNKRIALIGARSTAITTYGLNLDGNSNTVTFDGTMTNGASIKNFVIAGDDKNYPRRSGGICCNNGACPIITDNTIVESGHAGISCYGNSSPAITNNVIMRNGGGGIFCSHSSPFVVDNIIARNSEGGIMCDFASPSIINNSIVKNRGWGIYCNGKKTVPIIINNVIVKNGLWGVNNNLGNPIIDYNCIWGNGCDWEYGQIINNYDDCIAGKHDISVNPQFVGEGNYHLQSTSPCIDKGTNTASGIPSTDKDGNLRITNGRVDMGAYEYQGK